MEEGENPERGRSSEKIVEIFKAAIYISTKIKF